MQFREYYQHYLSLHENKWNRALHVFGQLITVLFFIFCIYERQWLLLLLAPFIVYPFAWSGHFFFEKNKPAAFSRPIWAKVCDWIMLKDIIFRRIK